MCRGFGLHAREPGPDAKELFGVLLVRILPEVLPEVRRCIVDDFVCPCVLFIQNVDKKPQKPQADAGSEGGRIQMERGR